MCELHRSSKARLRPRPPPSLGSRIIQTVFALTLLLAVAHLIFYNRPFVHLSTLAPYLVLSLASLVTLLIYRTLTFTNRQLSASSLRLPAAHATATVHFQSHADVVCQRLSAAIACPTVSHDDLTRVDHAHLLQLHAQLERSFPLVHKHLTRSVISTHSLLYVWQPAQPAQPAALPILLLAHLDVVPAPDAEHWRHPPFSGRRADGRIHGRGAIDDKNNLLAQLEAVEYLLSIRYQPSRAIYFAYGHDEETGGLEGARRVAERLAAQGVRFEWCLDEGLFVINRVVPLYPRPVALICVSEKGFVSAQLTVAVDAKEAGHSSAPGDTSAIGILGGALSQLQRTKAPSYYGANERALMEWLAHGFPFPMRVLVSNLWLFAPLLRLVMAAKPQTATTVRTTTALTVVRGGDKANVLPTQATAIVNHRVHPNDSVDGVLAFDRAVVADARVAVAAVGAQRTEPSAVSSAASRGFRCLHESVLAVYPGVSAAPALFVAGSDSKWYAALCDDVYRFSLTYMDSPAETAMFHGRDESISEVRGTPHRPNDTARLLVCCAPRLCSCACDKSCVRLCISGQLRQDVHLVRHCTVQELRGLMRRVRFCI